MVVDYEKKKHIVKLTLNRPESLNAFNADMHKELNAGFVRFREDPDAWVAIVTGSGKKAFSSGTDVKKVQEKISQVKGEAFPRSLWDSFFHIDLQAGLEVYKPVIAAINGYCIGMGLTLAMACDLRIAAESAKFAFPEVSIGVPTAVGAIRSTQIMGLGNALELLLLGEMKDAAWAYRTGLVNKVVPDDKLEAEVLVWAERLCQVGPLATRCTKEIAIRSQKMNFYDAVRMAEAMRRLLLSSEDTQEGLRAFREKRSPIYKGK